MEEGMGYARFGFCEALLLAYAKLALLVKLKVEPVRENRPYLNPVFSGQRAA